MRYFHFVSNYDIFIKMEYCFQIFDTKILTNLLLSKLKTSFKFLIIKYAPMNTFYLMRGLISGNVWWNTANTACVTTHIRHKRGGCNIATMSCSLCKHEHSLIRSHTIHMIGLCFLLVLFGIVNRFGPKRVTVLETPESGAQTESFKHQ